MTMVMAVGGSQTPCCTCWRSPRRLACRWCSTDFQRASDRVPLLADLKPSGKYVQEDLHGSAARRP
jgi:dihydroxy-acid dehydratase